LNINKIIFILIFCIAGQLKSQEYQDDAALWFNVYLEKKMGKFEIHLNQKNRINDNVSTYHLGYADMGLTYNINKNIKVLGDYVYGWRRGGDYTFNNRHRFYFALILKKKLGNWTFQYRNRVQIQYSNIYTSADGLVPEFYERNKLTVKYELNKRVSFYVAEELYFPFYQAMNKGFDRSRSFVGGTYALTKHNEIELYFAYQHELNAFDVTRRIFIYGIGYSHSF